MAMPGCTRFVLNSRTVVRCSSQTTLGGSIRSPSSTSVPPKYELRDRYLFIRKFFAREAFVSLRHPPVEHKPLKLPTSSSLRSIHTSLYRLADAKSPTDPLKDASPASPHNDGHTTESAPPRPSSGDEGQKDKPPDTTLHPHPWENYPAFIRRLLSASLPHVHRPTKDELLAVATGWWERLKIRFKWLMIRGFRKFNMDDLSAFVSWVVVGNAIWIVIGTTTFASVVLFTINSLQMQEFVARKVSDYLTRETGVMIVFESAIVPKWRDGKISFKKTYISKRPQNETFLRLATKKSKAHPAHTAATRMDAHYPAVHTHDHDHDHGEEDLDHSVAIDDQSTMFDLEIDSVDVELNFRRWLDGKGLVQSATIKGVRGVVDRRRVPINNDPVIDLASFRHIAQPGDFELQSLQLEDVLVTVYQPGDFRPYTASIFSADFRLLRRQWLFYDILSAKSIVGQFDNCLFSLHEPQSIGRTTQEDLNDSRWKRMSRFRIDGVNIDHLQASTGATGGPISWITSGKVDAVFDIKFPREVSDDVDIPAFLSEIASNVAAAAGVTTEGIGIPTLSLIDRIPGQHELAKPALRPPDAVGFHEVGGQKHQVVIDIDLRFRDLKAAVPYFPGELGYVNNALIRPIVAFINANRTLVPIHCRVVRDLSEFDGAWTAFETGLTDAIAKQIYDALAYHVIVANRKLRIKTVGAWSLQRTAQAVLATARHIVDPISAHLRVLYSMEGLYY